MRSARVRRLVVPSALLIVAGCSSDDDPPNDTTAPSVTATPGNQVFGDPTLEVSLSASDDRDSSPTIYYTTDATIPDSSSTVYTGPITLTDTAIVRFFAVDAAGNASAQELRGYTQATNQYELAWAGSGHGDIVGEPFRHWDEDGSVSTSCAKCHTPDGFVDYIEDGTVDVAAALPLGHACSACHVNQPFTRYNDLASHPELEPVAFPSGAHASTFADSNLCITCHQGRSSKTQVDAAIAANPGGTYGFINIHYYAAGATFFGAETQGAYQYDGLEYAGRNAFGSHEPEQASCVGCHLRGANKDHRLEPQVADCTSCHSGTSFETLSGSPAAHFTAISTLSEELFDAIQAYASGTLGLGIVYSPSVHPYFFHDTDGDGVLDPSEVSSGNRYQDFDERLLKAAYNYQTVLKDPAGYIHNGVYLHQVLHDSITDLGATPSIPAPNRPGWDREAASKTAQWHVSGHAHSTGEPFRHWDEDLEIPTSCARCHSQGGFIDYVADGTVDDPQTPSNLIGCATCHGSTNLFADSSTRFDDLVTNSALEPVAFPSGATASFGTTSNICITCHQGRASGVTVSAAAPNATVQSPTDYDSFDFVNRHYYAAGAILFGSDVTAAYEYPVATYRGQNDYSMAHDYRTDCVGCHMRDAADHVFVPTVDDCSTCHQDLVDFEELGMPFGAANVDYDGDGSGESFQAEIDGMAANLLVLIQQYARTGLPQPSPVVYAPTTHPYWFRDSDDDGLLSPGENVSANRYRDFDRRLLQAAFNYHSAQDPCGDMHNFKYVLQTLYDAMDDLDDGSLNSSALGIRP